ncbi:MAG: ABC transporter ATP-binding protein [Candidimonas sp.]|nr:MAG: ABC transporter ATP-binding protein [Burkholderiales bacterium 21-58-4]TAL89760.1 MAG: ABC transporter ATP-binding protein [Candidimonas sp.]TAM25322.1 MAG: ABC transporter ATP-binding protein [Candidimonas sp.]TAM77327.1 MAG: ABC transporter ATP-binding protein [Candidimonas sp.]
MNAASVALLSVRGLDAWYGAARILYGIDLEVRRGEVVALMGRNGAGKSTTLKAIMNLGLRRFGQISFMGHSITASKPFQIARLGVGYVPEDRRLFTGLSVRQNLDLGRQPERHWPDGRAVSAWTIEALFDLFPILRPLESRQAGTLSGGEQQMLTVARTLMGNPYVVLLDEPSEGVAPIVVEQMVAMILTLKQQGTSILLSEQNIHFAQLVADRAYVLEKGLVQYSGTMQEMRQSPEVIRSYLAI